MTPTRRRGQIDDPNLATRVTVELRPPADGVLANFTRVETFGARNPRDRGMGMVV